MVSSLFWVTAKNMWQWLSHVRQLIDSSNISISTLATHVQRESVKIIKNKTVYLEHSLNQQQHGLLKPHTNHYETVHYIIHFEAPLQILKLNKSLWYKPTRPRIKLDFPSGFTIWNIHHLLLKMEIKGRKGSTVFGSTRKPCAKHHPTSPQPYPFTHK